MSKEAVEVAPNSKEELQKQYTSFGMVQKGGEAPLQIERENE